MLHDSSRGSAERPVFAFTKLVVHDLEAMARFYGEAFGLNPIGRIQEQIDGEPIDEILLGGGTELAPGSLVLLKFVDRATVPRGGVILGFTTSDLPTLLERVRTAGGTIHEGIREMPGLGLRVAFAKDPEGHLSELVQMTIPAPRDG